MTPEYIKHHFPNASKAFIAANCRVPIELESPERKPPALQCQDEKEYTIEPQQYFEAVNPLQIICQGVFLGEPIPKQRPRIGKYGAYTPKTTKQYQRDLAASVINQLELPPLPGVAIGVRAAFYTRTYQRKDVDNMLKSVLDALNKLAFADDSQIKEVMAWAAVDCLNPRTEFMVYTLGKLSKTEGVCIQCSKRFTLTKDWRLRLFCSTECWIKSKSDSKAAVCLQCGKPTFSRPHKELKFCSPKCKSAAEKKERVNLTCSYCGTLFDVSPSDAARGARFCSHSCYSKAKIGTKRPAPSTPLSKSP